MATLGRIPTLDKKLSSIDKKHLHNYLTGKVSIRDTAVFLGRSQQRVYTLSNSLLRKAVMDGRIDVDELLKNTNT